MAHKNANAARASRRQALIGLGAAAMVSGCGGFLPRSGPTAEQILRPDPEQTLDFAIVDLNANAVRATRTSGASSFSYDFRGVSIQGDTLGVGDELAISIWENVEDGLFTSVGSKAAVIERVIVDENGAIYVPYAGAVRARGRTVAEVRNVIRAALEKKVIKPEVAVARVTSNSRAVSVQGSVGQPGVYPLAIHQDRLLPVIAAAGGAKGDPHLMQVQVRRGDVSSTAWLEDVYTDPASNIALRSGDVVLLQNQEPHFNAFGAVKRSGRIQLKRRDASLIDAISEVGGLNEQTAEATGVFVFRREPAEMLDKIGAKRPRQAHGLESEVEHLDGAQPVVYQLRFNRAEAMFLASEFQVRPDDTIYVTEAPYSAWRKVLSIIVPSIGTAGSVAGLGNTLGN